MIDPTTLITPDSTTPELEDFLLFSIVVAGKTANTQAIALQKFYDLNLPGGTPFEIVRNMIVDCTLLSNLQTARIGQYHRIERAFRELVEANLNLHTCTVEDLERIHGIGKKTSRFFIVHSRGCQDYAILDTHILKYLRNELGVDAPKSTPGNPATYKYLQGVFIQHAKDTNRDVAELDLEIWTKYSEKSRNK